MPITGTSGSPENFSALAGHGWKPGQSGNPAGTPNVARQSIKQYLNNLGGKTEWELLKILKDGKEDWQRRAAALVAIRVIQVGDLADFEPVIHGLKTLAQLRQDGIDTTIVKKLKFKARKVKKSQAEEGTVEEISCEIELHDRVGPNFDRVCNQTGGKPEQAVAVAIDGQIDMLLNDATRRPAWLDRAMKNDN